MSDSADPVDGLRKAARRVFWEAKNIETAKKMVEAEKDKIIAAAMLVVADWMDRCAERDDSDIDMPPSYYEGDDEAELSYGEGFRRGHREGYSQALSSFAHHIRMEHDDNYKNEMHRKVEESKQAYKKLDDALTREYGPRHENGGMFSL